MVRVWARYSGSDALESYNRKESRREHSIISEPAIQVEPANARLAARILCRADAQTPLLKGCRDGEVFFSYFPRPNATLFVITRPLVHNAMSILVPDRWIFIIKTGRDAVRTDEGFAD